MFRVVQLTPQGSTCSMQIGVGLTDAAPGSVRGLYPIVEDLQATLTQRGLEVSEIRHKSPIDDWRGGWAPGLDPIRRDYVSFADFTDPTATNRCRKSAARETEAATRATDSGR